MAMSSDDWQKSTGQNGNVCRERRAGILDPPHYLGRHLRPYNPAR